MSGLKQLLDDTFARSKKNADRAILDLMTMARDLDMKETASGLEEAAKQLASETFQIIVVGRFKNGKSTLLNALLGKTTRPVEELASGQGPMPVNDLPCTATLTSIKYAEEPTVLAWGFDRTFEHWSIGRYLRESVIRANEQETREFFRNIRQFDMGFPAELCQSGVTMLDSPGTSDTPERTEVTRQAIAKCDAALVVYRSDALAGEDERRFVDATLRSTSTRIFTVVNLQNGRNPDDERFRRFVWDRLVTELHQGPSYAKQDFSAQNIYFVDAKRAEQGKLLGDAKEIEGSGLGTLERKLGEFLLNERHRVHFEKSLNAAENSALAIEQQIRQRRAALRLDTDELNKALEAIQPQLAQIHERRRELPLIFKRYRALGQQEIRTGFERVIIRLHQDLPDKLAAHKLSSEGLLAALREKKMMEEAYSFCEKEIGSTVAAWCNGASTESGDNARKILEPILEALLQEVGEEVAEIEREFEQIQYQVSGFKLEPGEQQLLSRKEQIWSTVVGILVLRNVAAVAGISTGFRGLAFNVAGQVAALIAFWSFPALVPVGMILFGTVGGTVGGSLGLVGRVKEKVLEYVLPNLKEVEKTMGARLEEETAQHFDNLAAHITEAVTAVIEEREKNLKSIAENNQRNQAEKNALLSAMDQSLRRIAALRQQLTVLKVDGQQSA